MLDGTYDGLKESLPRWLMRVGDSELSSDVLEEIIQIAEEDIFDRLDIQVTQTRDPAFVLSGEYTALPTGFLRFSRPIRLVSPSVGRLRLASPAYLDENYAADSSGPPTFFCLEGNEIRINPPDGSYTCDIAYYAATGSVLSGTEGPIITAYPSLYLYGALKASAGYIGEDGRIPVWGTEYERILRRIRTADQNKRYGAGGAPTLSGATP